MVEPPRKKKHSILSLLLVLGGIGLFGCLVLGISGYFWAKNYGEAFVTSTKEQTERGARYGEGRGPEECISETLAQVKDCAPINVKCTLKGQLFVHGCLAAAIVPEEFCADMPASSDIFDSISFRKNKCAARGFDDKGQCAQVMQNVQGFCDAQR